MTQKNVLSHARFVIMALVMLWGGASEASYVPSCGKAFQELRVNTRKVEGHEKVVSARSAAWLKLSKVAQKALKTYQGLMKVPESESMSIQINEYKTLFTENKVKGININISAGGDEDNVSYFFDSKGKMLYWYWYNQTPVSRWVCEGYRK